MLSWSPPVPSRYSPPSTSPIQDMFWTPPYHVALLGPWPSRVVLADVEICINNKTAVFWQVLDPRMFTFVARVEIPRQWRDDCQWSLSIKSTSRTNTQRQTTRTILRPSTSLGRISMMTLAKYDAPYIAEWLTYHRSLGIEHAYVYNNGSKPLSAAIKPFVGTFVTEVDWPYPYAMYSAEIEPFWNPDSHMWTQPTAMVHAALKYGVNWDWMAFIDADEFLCPMKHDSLLPILDMADQRRFVEQIFHRPGSLQLRGKWFGTSGHATLPPGPIVANYTKCERFCTSGQKTIVRPDAAIASAVHYWTTEGETQYVPESVLRFNHYRSISDHSHRRGPSFDRDFTNECSDTRVLDLARMHKVVP